MCGVAADLKTRQGLKPLFTMIFPISLSFGCSGLENPTGIETDNKALVEGGDGIVAADLKTRQGLKLSGKSLLSYRKHCCSGLENPTGIETEPTPVKAMHFR